MIRALAIFLLILVISSCKKESKLVLANGREMTRIVELNNELNHFTINDNFDIQLTEDSIFECRISGPKNILKHLIISQDGNRFEIINPTVGKIVRPQEELLLDIHYPRFDSLNLTGYGFISNNDTLRTLNFISTYFARVNLDLSINTSNLYFTQQDGANQINLSGNCDNLYIYHYALGNINASELFVENGHIHHNGESDILANILESGIFEMRGTGNLIIPSYPTEYTTDFTNSGEIIISP